MALPKFKKKYVASALAAGLAMGAGGIAAAYFSASGGATKSVTVASPVTFTVSPGVVSGGLYPGGTAHVNFTVTNVASFREHFNADASLTMTGAPTGCKASWFQISAGPTPGSDTLAKHGTSGTSTTVTVTVSMVTNTTTQNACAGYSPTVHLSLSPIEDVGLFSQDGGSAEWATGNKAVVLQLSAPSQATEAAGIQLFNEPSTLPTAAPTFTTTAYNAGSPRWVIFFTTGGYVFGTPSAAGRGATNWTIEKPTYEYGKSWTTVKSQFSSQKVTEVYIVMDTDQAPPSTSKITHLSYGATNF